MREGSRSSESVSLGSRDIMTEQVAQLRALFPHIFTEGRLDFDALRTAFTGAEAAPERYAFTWTGKRSAVRLLQAVCRSTLVPHKDESVHFADTRNIFIAGDNLEVLKLLRRAYAARIKLIYIDPPYNTGNKFVYPDRFSDPLDTYLRLSGQKDGAGLLVGNPETNGRYHSSWLSMMYPRLFLARQLLRPDGAMFVSIDDHEVHNLRMLMNEVFGEENFVATIIWQKKYTRSNDARWFSDNHEYILVYARSKERFKLNLQPRTSEQNASYTNPDHDPRGPWKATPLHAKSGRVQNFHYTFRNGLTWSPPAGTYPRYLAESLARMEENNEIWFGKDGTSTPARKSFLSAVKAGVTPVTLWFHDEVGHNHEANNELKSLQLEGTFNTPKPTRLIKRIVELVTSPSDDDIVLDFFAGSCTTAHAVLALNHEDGGKRRFIMVQLPEPMRHPAFPTIADLGKERIRRVLHSLQTKQTKQTHPQEDAGFRVFTLAPSSFECWDGDVHHESLGEETYLEQASLSITPLREHWQPEHVTWEVVLKEGYALHSHIRPLVSARQNRVWRVHDPDQKQSFCICLDDAIHQETIEHLELSPETLFVCRAVALTDELTMYLTGQCHLKMI